MKSHLSIYLFVTNKAKRPTAMKAMAPGRRVQQEHTRIQISEPQLAWRLSDIQVAVAVKNIIMSQ